MTAKQRLDYVDCALRINNINLSKHILETTLHCVDLVDKSKGKVTLDQCLINNPKEAPKEPQKPIPPKFPTDRIEKGKATLDQCLINNPKT